MHYKKTNYSNIKPFCLRLLKTISTLLIILIILENFFGTIHSFAEYSGEMTSEEFLEEIGRMLETYDSTNPSLASASKGADSDFICCRLIVKTKPGESLVTDYSAIDRIDGPNSVFILQYSSPEETEAAYENYSISNYVEYVEPDYYFEINNEEYDSNVVDTSKSGNNEDIEYWGSNETKTIAVINELKEHNIKLTEVKVAVFDSGMNFTNKNIDKSRYGECHNIYGDQYGTTDRKGHGTAVAYTIEKNTPETVKIFPYKTANPHILSIGQSDYALYATSLKTASEKVDIINISGTLKPSAKTAEKNYLKETIKNVYNNGTLVVFAAGNDGEDISNQGLYSDDNAYIITVAAIDINLNPMKQGELSSNYGSSVDISAPGEDIYCAYILNSITPRTGTSFAAPFVTAALAILKSAKPGLTNAQCESILKTHVTVPAGWDDDNYGTGILNVEKMVKEALSEYPSITLSSNKAIITAKENSKIYYTTDGSVPVAGISPVYTVPVDTSNAKTICAVACETEKYPSCVAQVPIKLAKDKKLFRGQTIKLKLKENERLINTFSTDESIVKIDVDGTITGISRGEAKVIAKTNLNRRFEYNITVNYSPLQWFIIIFLFGFLWYI